MAEWYVDNLGCTLARAGGPLVNGRLLLDSGGSVMLRDPWGIAVQLIKRAAPMV